MHVTEAQWIVGLSAALLVGISKTGVPGVGIVVVPMLAWAFGGRLSAGIMLPMLVMGDMFAVAWYRRHAQWDKLVGLLPWVYLGLVFGTAALVITGRHRVAIKDPTAVIIGVLVIAMVIVYLLKNRLGEKFQPTSPAGVAGTGVAAGFSTTVANAAGPVMQMFLAAHKLPKEAFMGTISWYFFIVNLSKFPIYVVLSRLMPTEPIVTTDSLMLNVMAAPAIVVGVFVGKWLLPRIPQKSFEGIVIGTGGGRRLEAGYPAGVAVRRLARDRSPRGKVSSVWRGGPECCGRAACMGTAQS